MAMDLGIGVPRERHGQDGPSMDEDRDHRVGKVLTVSGGTARAGTPRRRRVMSDSVWG